MMLLNQKYQTQICSSVFKLLTTRVGRFISSSYMWHCRVKRSCLFMSGILRLGQHINLPSQPRMPRETSAETNDDPGSFTYPAAAQSRYTDHGALEMHTAWPYFWEPRIRWLCSYIQRKTGKIWRWTSASVALKSLLMCGIVNSSTTSPLTSDFINERCHSLLNR